MTHEQKEYSKMQNFKLTALIGVGWITYAVITGIDRANRLGRLYDTQD